MSFIDTIKNFYHNHISTRRDNAITNPTSKEKFTGFQGVFTEICKDLGLKSHSIPKIALFLEGTDSMDKLYSNGWVQGFIESCLILSHNLHKNDSTHIETYVFGEHCTSIGTLTPNNYQEEIKNASLPVSLATSKNGKFIEGVGNQAGQRLGKYPTDIRGVLSMTDRFCANYKDVINTAFNSTTLDINQYYNHGILNYFRNDFYWGLHDIIHPEHTLTIVLIRGQNKSIYDCALQLHINQYKDNFIQFIGINNPEDSINFSDFKGLANSFSNCGFTLINNPNETTNGELFNKILTSYSQWLKPQSKAITSSKKAGVFED